LRAVAQRMHTAGVTAVPLVNDEGKLVTNFSSSDVRAMAELNTDDFRCDGGGAAAAAPLLLSLTRVCCVCVRVCAACWMRARSRS
jgi:hypothetical protein